MAPVDIAGLERLLDQQSAKARAIDKQVAGYGLAAIERHAGDKARIRILSHLTDTAFDACDATRLGVGAQEKRIKAGVEMIGMG